MRRMPFPPVRSATVSRARNTRRTAHRLWTGRAPG